MSPSLFCFFSVLFVGRDAFFAGRGVDGTGVIGRISSDGVYALDGEGGRLGGRLGGL